MRDRAGLDAAAIRRLVAERHRDPFAILDALDRQPSGDDERSARTALAWWARGLVLYEVSRPSESALALRRAADLATEIGDADIEARARASLAVTLRQMDDPSGATAQLERALAVSPPSALGFVTFLIGLDAQRRGLHHEALAHYGVARGLLQEVDDDATIGLLHLNAAVAHTYLGNERMAREESALAERIAERHALTMLAAMAAHNVGFLEGRRGRLAAALRALDRAQARYRELTGRPRQLPVLFTDRAEVLLLAGLAADARDSALQALDELTDSANEVDRAEALLLLARASIAVGDFAEARTVALRAARGFRCSQRAGWAVLACFIGRHAEFEMRVSAGASRALARRFARLAERLRAHGWPVEARDAYVHASLSIVDVDVAAARALLRLAQSERVPAATPFQARFYRAKALCALHEGHRDRALEQIRRGIQNAQRVLAASAATDAAIEALRYAGDLAQLGVDIALAERRAAPVLRAIERQRAIVSTFPRMHAAGDDGDDAMHGRDDDRHVPESVRRERSLRTQSGGHAGAPVVEDVHWSELRHHLSGRSMVYYVESGSRLGAVVLTDRATRLVDLGDASGVTADRAFVQFALTSLAVSHDEGRERRALARVERDARQLDDALVAPLALGDGPLVVVPSPSTDGIPWRVLPGLRHVDITVVPSAASWMRAMARRNVAGSNRQLLVAGPRLASADSEIRALHTLYPSAITLRGEEARVDAVLAALDGTDLVHIAAHGVHRRESPMFSSLELVDGPLTIYDLERLRRPPTIVILPACEAAAARVYSSGGALGTAQGLLHIGAATVVAPTLPVADEATRDNMIAFHTHLAAGHGPARSLRLAANDALESEDPSRLAAIAPFLVFGAA